jgi:hypothetical protein
MNEFNSIQVYKIGSIWTKQYSSSNLPKRAANQFQSKLSLLFRLILSATPEDVIGSVVNQQQWNGTNEFSGLASPDYFFEKPVLRPPNWPRVEIERRGKLGG